MRYLSICSGIEAATEAWHPLGWQPVAFAEIEAFPSAVLAHHYPHVPNWGDITKFKEWPDATFDLLVGGTPCQSFSVAGLRKGIADPRGNLALTYLAIAAHYRPRWVVWENVPGVLSSDEGQALGAFLGGLAELGYGFAWRVLDAQYFGLAQRRKRVFVVGHLGDWRRAAAVLFDTASLRGDPAPRRETGKGTADDVAGSLGSRGNKSHTELSIYPEGGQGADLTATEIDVAPALSSKNEGVPGYDRGTRIATTAQVRRLTPRECERLQGFPDDYTLIPYRNKLAADGPRYKALGNSMAVPCMRWIGERIAWVESIIREAA